MVTPACLMQSPTVMPVVNSGSATSGGPSAINWSRTAKMGSRPVLTCNMYWRLSSPLESRSLLSAVQSWAVIGRITYCFSCRASPFRGAPVGPWRTMAYRPSHLRSAAGTNYRIRCTGEPRSRRETSRGRCLGIASCAPLPSFSVDNHGNCGLRNTEFSRNEARPHASGMQSLDLRNLISFQFCLWVALAYKWH